MTHQNHPNRAKKAFALVDAEGSFGSAGRGRSYVHSAHATIEAATRAANRTANVQIVTGDDWRATGNAHSPPRGMGMIRAITWAALEGAAILGFLAAGGLWLLLTTGGLPI